MEVTGVQTENDSNENIVQAVQAIQGSENEKLQQKQKGVHASIFQKQKPKATNLPPTFTNYFKIVSVS